MEENTLLQIKKRQRINAYMSMCYVGILMIAIRFLSHFFSKVVYALKYQLLDDFVKTFSALISNLFGVSKLDAFTAVKAVFSSAAFDSIISMAVSLLTMVLPAFLFSKMHKNKFDDCFVTKGKISKNIFLLFCFSQLFASAMSVLSNMFYTYFFGQENGAVSQIPAYTDGFSAFVTFLQICVFVPIIEEYVFRGVIFGNLKKHGASFAAVASAFSFAIMHSDAVQANYAFTFGILSALLYDITGNIKTSIVLHMLNNSVSIFFNYATDWFGKPFSNALLCIYSIIIAVFGVYAITLFLKKDGYLEKFKSNEENSNLGDFRAGLFEILCAPVVFYVLVYAFEIVFAEMFV